MSLRINQKEGEGQKIVNLNDFRGDTIRIKKDELPEEGVFTKGIPDGKFKNVEAEKAKEAEKKKFEISFVPVEKIIENAIKSIEGFKGGSLSKEEVEKIKNKYNKNAKYAELAFMMTENHQAKLQEQMKVIGKINEIANQITIFGIWFNLTMDLLRDKGVISQEDIEGIRKKIFPKGK